MIDDPYDLERFVVAQNAGGSYAAAAAELRAGKKSGHWMWFVFPQIAGLGASSMSQRYAISSLEEARGYLAHPILGKRLLECARVLAELEGRTAQDVFCTVDAMKLRSSMTLFARAAPDDPLFLEVLDRYFAGRVDGATDARLEARGRRYLPPTPSMESRRPDVTEREREDEQSGPQYGGDRGGGSAGEAGGQGGDSDAAGDAARDQRTQSVAEQEGNYAGTESGGEEGGGADA